jgi:drug/metabolite transporter (DMT)-like permease
MQSNWLFLIVIAGISAAVFNSLLRAELRNGRDPTAYAWWYELIRLAFFGLLIPFFPQFDFSWLNLALLAVLGLVELGAVFVYMKMHGATELSLSTIIMQLRNIYVPIIAFFVLGEVLTRAQWLGIVLVVVGAIIVARPRSLSVDRSMSYALIAGLMTALSSIIFKVTSNFASLPILLFAFSLPSVLLLPLLMQDALPRLRAASRYVVSSNLPASAVNIIAMYALVNALHLGPAGTTTAIFQGVSMLAVASGVLFLGERDHKMGKLVAAAITTVGIILLV